MVNCTLAFKGFYPELTHIDSFRTSLIEASHGIIPKVKEEVKCNPNVYLKEELKYWLTALIPTTTISQMLVIGLWGGYCEQEWKNLSKMLPRNNSIVPSFWWGVKSITTHKIGHCILLSMKRREQTGEKEGERWRDRDREINGRHGSGLPSDP